MLGILGILILLSLLIVPLFIKYCRKKNINTFGRIVIRATLVYIATAYILALIITLLDYTQKSWYMIPLTAGMFALYGIVMFSIFFVPMIIFLGKWLSKDTKRPE